MPFDPMITYRPPRFREDDRARLLTLAADVGFGLLVADRGAYCPVPFDVDAGGPIRFHLARANPTAGALDGRTVDLLITGPHGYVSPTWYAAVDEVPTWNYVVIAVRGTVRAVADDELPALLRRQVARYEPTWSPDDLSPESLDGMIRGIRGFELHVEHIEGKVKLSQNRSPEDHARVAERLGGELGRLTAEALRRRA